MPPISRTNILWLRQIAPRYAQTFGWVSLGMSFSRPAVLKTMCWWFLVYVWDKGHLSRFGTFYTSTFRWPGGFCIATTALENLSNRLPGPSGLGYPCFAPLALVRGGGGSIHGHFACCEPFQFLDDNLISTTAWVLSLAEFHPERASSKTLCLPVST